MSPILECRDLVKAYGSHPALQGLNLRLDRGRIVGLLGPNGSGKTTLIKLACGLLRPTRGEILVDGKVPGPLTKGQVSYLPERMAVEQWMKADQLVGFYQDFYQDFDGAKAREMLAALKVDPRDTIKTMSKGTREKVQLVLVMSRQADLYLLDEPIGGVDPATRDYILRTIIGNYSENSTVVISTHLIADVENVLDDVVMIHQGTVMLQSTVDDIRENQGKSVDELFREVFRC